MRSQTKPIIFAVVAVILLSILRVEVEARFGVDLFYVWLGAICAIIGLFFGRFYKQT